MLSRSIVSDSLQPHDCSLPGSSVHGIFQARILEWVAILSSRDLPKPGIKLRPPAVQADTSPYELPGKSKNSGLGSLSLLQGIFPTPNGTGVSYIADGFFTRWATREAQSGYTVKYYQPGDQISPLNLHIPFKFISIPTEHYICFCCHYSIQLPSLLHKNKF